VTQSTRAAAAELVTYAARLTRAVRRVANPGAAGASLRLLSILDELGPSTVTALAEADRTSQPTMTAAVNALVERGWAGKRPHPDDARSCLVELTDPGRAQLAAARRQHGEILADRLPPYTTDDVREATALIKHLLENHE
jgi:DNA-binding MarR family transcriptional regulator